MNQSSHSTAGAPAAPAPPVLDRQQRCLVRLAHVSKSWAEDKRGGLVLRDINLDISEGEFLTILGPSASGKSTLLRIITGLVQPTSGQIIYRQRPPHEINPFAAMVFQSPSLFPWLTVQENVELVLKARGYDPEARRKRALALIDLVGLDGFETAYPRELSVGMRQRVGLARALAVEPELLCLDEPFSALDLLTAENLRRELLGIWLDKKIPLPRAIVMVSHNIEEVALMADRVIVLGKDPGRVLADLRVPFPHPRNRTASEFTHFVDTVYKIVTHPAEAPAALVAAADREQPAPRMPALPHARIGMLNGLMELVASRNGREDLHRLGTYLLMEVDDLLPIAEAARLLQLAQVAEGDLILTELGRRYAEAKGNTKKQTFRRQIVGLPLFTVILNVLTEKEDHRMNREFFQELLENHLSEKEAGRQLARAIEWGRYAELFGFNDDTDELYLEEGEAAAALPGGERPDSAAILEL